MIDPVFTLHPRLAADSFAVGRFPLCRLLLINDRQYPWFVLVPERVGLTELHHLQKTDRNRLWRESALLAEAMEKAFQPDKLNIAAIGNLVPQLHLHHIARYRNDKAWPRPVWGAFPAEPYPTGSERTTLNRLLAFLPELSADGRA